MPAMRSIAGSEILSAQQTPMGEIRGMDAFSFLSALPRSCGWGGHPATAAVGGSDPRPRVRIEVTSPFESDPR